MMSETKRIKKIEEDIASKQEIIRRMHRNVGIGYMNKVTRSFINKKKREISSLNKQIDTLLEAKHQKKLKARRQNRR